MTARLLRQLLLPLFALMVASAACGEIISLKKIHGKEVACTQSGLRGAYSSCGASDFYSNVLVGKIISVVALPHDESKLIIAPEEVFRGDHPTQLVVITNQGLCIGDFRVGDRWLFFLFHADYGKGLPVLEYAHGSAPVAEAQGQIALLRQQVANPLTGTIRGTLSKKSKTYLVPHHVVTLRSTTGKTQTATTDEKGQFEFDSLSPSSYVLGDFEDRSKKVEIPVGSQGCYSVDLTLSRGGRVVWAW